MSDGDWTWELSSNADDDLDALDSHEQERVLDKLDEIVDSPGGTHRTTVNHSKTAHTGKFVSASSASQ